MLNKLLGCGCGMLMLAWLGVMFFAFFLIGPLASLLIGLSILALIGLLGYIAREPSSTDKTE